MQRISLYALIFLLSACATSVPQDALKLHRVSYETLPAWKKDAHGKALEAFVRSCDKFETMPLDYWTGELTGTIEDWMPVCQEAQAIHGMIRSKKGGHVIARQFFENHFVPFRASSGRNSTGLFTGYYEIELKGSTKRTEKYRYPLYRVPEQVELLRKTRTEIDAGALDGKGLELAYVEDPVRLFFLHIQGSGRIVLEDGSILRAGYAGQNGQAYTSIGKYLIEKGVFAPDEVTAPLLKQWLYKQSPEKALAVMQQNESYVFFRDIGKKGPYGAQGAVLTPERSLAVDNSYVPYGVPVWLVTTLPDVHSRGKEMPYQRLFEAQDRGGAIKGPVRGDVFFGAGKRAEKLAGHMKQKGEYYLLLPKAVVVRSHL